MSFKATTRSTRSPRVTSSRTSVFSWSTSTRPRPRRPVPRSSPTRWRPAVSRTRFVKKYFEMSSANANSAISGCSRASPSPCSREACCDPGCRARSSRQGVNTCIHPRTPSAHTHYFSLVYITLSLVTPLALPCLYLMPRMLSTIKLQAAHAFLLGIFRMSPFTRFLR